MDKPEGFIVLEFATCDQAALGVEVSGEAEEMSCVHG
jgi:hypothetical protein